MKRLLLEYLSLDTTMKVKIRETDITHEKETLNSGIQVVNEVDCVLIAC